MATIPFAPLSEQPHYRQRLLCQMCGHVALHVWPQLTLARVLECAQCQRIGTLVPAPVEAQPTDTPQA